jgi:hypothetical protein
MPSLRARGSVLEVMVIVVVGEIALTAGGVLEVLDDEGGCVMVRSRASAEVARRRAEAIGIAARPSSPCKPSTGETRG